MELLALCQLCLDKIQQASHSERKRAGRSTGLKYLGSFISADSNLATEVSSRIGQAVQAFKRLNNIWKSTTLHTRAKLKLYESNVHSVLLYAAETWGTNCRLESRVKGVEGRCLRKILGLWWEQKVINREVWKLAGINDIVQEVKVGIHLDHSKAG